MGEKCSVLLFTAWEGNRTVFRLLHKHSGTTLEVTAAAVTKYRIVGTENPRGDAIDIRLDGR